LPIAEHGVIGDQRSVALVGTDGTIDWYCPERFDGPSVFAAILDRRRGGFYRIAPADPQAQAQAKQLYLPETNVLITRFLSPQGVAEIQDFMPLGGERQRLIRRVVGVRGRLRFRLDLEPRFDYGRVRPTVQQAAERRGGHSPSPCQQRSTSSRRPPASAPSSTSKPAKAERSHSKAASAPHPSANRRPRNSCMRPRARGEPGSGTRPTPAAGARWCTAPP
jgi:GH15 family glucan-1,4-alpha-glucosidase